MKTHETVRILLYFPFKCKLLYCLNTLKMISRRNKYDTEIFYQNGLEMYLARPECLENITFAEFFEITKIQSRNDSELTDLLGFKIKERSVSKALKITIPHIKNGIERALMLVIIFYPFRTLKQILFQECNDEYINIFTLERCIHHFTSID